MSSAARSRRSDLQGVDHLSVLAETFRCEDPGVVVPQSEHAHPAGEVEEPPASAQMDLDALGALEIHPGQTQRPIQLEESRIQMLSVEFIGACENVCGAPQAGPKKEIPIHYSRAKTSTQDQQNGRQPHK